MIRQTFLLYSIRVMWGSYGGMSSLVASILHYVLVATEQAAQLIICPRTKIFDLYNYKLHINSYIHVKWSVHSYVINTQLAILINKLTIVATVIGLKILLEIIIIIIINNTS